MSLDRLVYFLLLAFVVVCVFDPADQVRAKIPLFVALWAVTLPRMLATLGSSDFPLRSTFYVAAFVAVPMLALVRYGLVNGSLPAQAFSLFKGYLLIAMVIVLVVNRVDLFPILSATLLALACVVIVLFIAIQLNYSGMYNALQPIGLSLQLFYLDERRYGNFLLLQVFFATSPMLVMAIAYYFDRAMSEVTTPRGLYWALTAICVVGMFLAGTRNNIIVSLLLPFLLWPLYARRPGLTALCSIVGVTLLTLLFMAYLQAFLDPAEFSNNIKLMTVMDYIRIWSDPKTLLLGQGLAVSHNWSARGDFVLTELTYFELIRNFGLLGAFIMLALLALPVLSAIFFPTSRRDKALAIAWFLYLVMSASNPILFSSMGTLILSGLIANVFPLPDRAARMAKREMV